VNAIFLNNFIAKRIKMQTPADKGVVADTLIAFTEEGEDEFHGFGEYLY